MGKFTRVIQHEKLKNKIILVCGGLVTLFLIIGTLLKLEGINNTICSAFLFITVTYSMFLSVKTNPSLLIKHREKQEQVTARFFLIALPAYTIIGSLNAYYEFTAIPFYEEAMIISLILIGLSISKISDDIQRLSLLNTIQPNKIADKTEKYQLTDREKEVTRLLLAGHSYKRIAEDLFISLPTVKTHVSNIYKKTQSKNKVELINLLNNHQETR